MSPRVLIAAALLSLVLVPAAFGQMTSSGYRLDPATVASSSGPLSSSGFTLSGSAGQPSESVGSSSSGYVLQPGYWGLMGVGPVPVRLVATKAPGSSSIPFLEWSGNSPQYSVYRSTVCTEPITAQVVRQSGKTYTDSSSPPAELLCYDVRPYP